MTAIAFYTTGDTDPACPGVPQSPSITSGYRTLANHFAPGHAHGVPSIYDAVRVLRDYTNGQPPVLFSEIHFVGHGEPDGRYVFGGRRDQTPNHRFHNGGQWCTTANSAIDMFLDALVAASRAPSPNGRVRIFLHACWSANGGSNGGRFAQEISDGFRRRRGPHGEILGAPGQVITHVTCVMMRNGQIGIQATQRTNMQVVLSW